MSQDSDLYTVNLKNTLEKLGTSVSQVASKGHFLIEKSGYLSSENLSEKQYVDIHQLGSNLVLLRAHNKSIHQYPQKWKFELPD